MEDKRRQATEDERFEAFAILMLDPDRWHDREAKIANYYRVCGIRSPVKYHDGNPYHLVTAGAQAIWPSLRRMNLESWLVWGNAATYRYWEPRTRAATPITEE